MGLDKLPGMCYNVVIKREENKTMNVKSWMNSEREALLTRVIHVYGMEHEVTKGFAWLCEHSPISTKALECLCIAHETFPYTGE